MRDISLSAYGNGPGWEMASSDILCIGYVLSYVFVVVIYYNSVLSSVSKPRLAEIREPVLLPKFNPPAFTLRW